MFCILLNKSALVADNISAYLRLFLVVLDLGNLQIARY